MDVIFKGIFDTELTNVIEVGDFLLAVGVSLLLGFIIAAAYLVRSEHTRSFLATLILLPSAVCVVIMMVNGNIGTGVAVAGAFSLVRFRSAPGTAKEIVTLFLAMGAGLVAGMGYLGYAVLFTVISSAVLIIASIAMCKNKSDSKNKTLKITIPEDLDYTRVFDDIFEEYTKVHELTKVKSTNFGSMFRLTYNITLRDALKEKEMIDKIRERNGNLEILVSRRENGATEL